MTCVPNIWSFGYWLMWSVTSLLYHSLLMSCLHLSLLVIVFLSPFKIQSWFHGPKWIIYQPCDWRVHLGNSILKEVQRSSLGQSLYSHSFGLKAIKNTHNNQREHLLKRRIFATTAVCIESLNFHLWTPKLDMVPGAKIPFWECKPPPLVPMTNQGLILGNYSLGNQWVYLQSNGWGFTYRMGAPLLRPHWKVSIHPWIMTPAQPHKMKRERVSPWLPQFIYY